MRFNKREFDTLRKIHLYISAGFNLRTSLEKSGETKLLDYIDKGLFLSDALRNEGFPEFVIYNVKIAEETGKLKQILGELVSILDMHRKFTKDIRITLLMPAVTLSLALAMIFATVRFLVPEIAGLFMDLGIDVPDMLSFLLSISEIIEKEEIEIFFLALVLSIPAVPFFVSPSLLFRSAVLSLTAKALLICLRNGIEIQRALLLVSNILDRERDREKIIQDSVSIVQGKNPSFSLFGEMSDELKMAYDIGELPKVLEAVSRIYEEKAKSEMEFVRKSAEPAFFILVATIVVFFAVSVYAPLISGLENMLRSY